MAATSQIDAILAAIDENRIRSVVAQERQKSLMLRAWVLSGVFFMALPGTLLDFSNLMWSPSIVPSGVYFHPSKQKSHARDPGKENAT